MSKYDNQMEFFGGKDTGEWCFTLGTLKLDERLVIVDRKHVEALEECAGILDELETFLVAVRDGDVPADNDNLNAMLALIYSTQDKLEHSK